MKVVLFGATGMIGQGALRECLLDTGVETVLAVGRRATAQSDAKLRELVAGDLTDFSGSEAALEGFDACFYCLGVSSAGLTEEAYRRVTYDMPLAAARVLSRQNPGMTFVYVSGAGADATGRGRVMWARVKGQAENALLEMPFRAVYVFRPAFIQPLHGIRSRTKAYRAFYDVLAPALPVLKAVFPRYVTTTEQVGRAMLVVAREGASKRVLETPEINAL